MGPIPRRRFIEVSTLATAAALARPSHSAASERVTVAFIGLGGQGRNHLKSYVAMKDVDIAYVCDVDEGHLAEAKKISPAATAVSDLRRVLDARDVDAVVIATPDHWHTPAALLALDAGKHVYVEKPCSHNVREGRLLVAAVQRSGKQLQHGTQSRSYPFVAASMQLLRDGVIGDVLVAKAWNVQSRAPIGKAKPSQPPTGFDYDMWVGPAPMLPFQSNRQHYTWHWWYNFGTGDAGNDGVHELDIARWGLGVDVHPSQVAAIGGKYAVDDDQEFPDTLTAAFEYPGKEGAVGQRRQLLFEMRLWSRYAPFSIDNGNEFLGTKGRMLLTKRGKVEVTNEKGERIPLRLPDEKAPGGLAVHQANFLNAIRTGEALTADALTGHLSSSLPHLANIACRVGSGFRFDPQTERIVDNAQANALLGREYRQNHWATPRVST